jgi:RNA polymerase-binding transcription factor
MTPETRANPRLAMGPARAAGYTSYEPGGLMDPERARALLESERAEVRQLLSDTTEAGAEDREAEDDALYASDAAQPLTAEGMDDAVAESLRDRLDTINRALKRIDDGTYGLSVRSGEPIPDERLEADPAAELTVEEARAAERG